MNEPRPGPSRSAIVLSVVALLVGIAIAWVDTRPAWEDTGVSAALVTLAAGVLAAFGLSFVPAALVVCVPLVVLGLLAGNVGSLLALAFGALGAVAGSLFRRTLGRDARRPSA